MNAPHSRIQLLPTRLANQIAAGEVVERPASVVKELIENSLDAGATRVDIDLEHAGIRRLLISDNGNGIHRDDLTLALARHATSKIHSIDDLSAIHSLGFRGEALASIASIARLTLTSRARDAESAWSAFADGHDMNVKVQPAALNHGTRVEVADLFYNTPARRRFLRSESTELQHIEEVVKRAALAAPHCGFYVRHNGKTVKQWRACTHWQDRVRQVLGDSFAHHALPFQQQVDQVQLSGLIAPVSAHRAQTDLQYVFVNGRVIRDRVVQHALRAGFADLIPEGRAPAYVVFIAMPATDVDVNVHPTKHEVRFRHARWMHDLLTSTVAQTLAQTPAQTATISVPPAQSHSPVLSLYRPASPVVTPYPAAAAIAEQQAFYTALSQPLAPRMDTNISVSVSTSFVRLSASFVLLHDDREWLLCDWPVLLTQWLQHSLSNAVLRPLLMPVVLPVTDALNDAQQALRLQLKSGTTVLLAAPNCLVDCEWPALLSEWQGMQTAETQVAAHLQMRVHAHSKTVALVRAWLKQQALSSLPVRKIDDAFLRAQWAS